MHAVASAVKETSGMVLIVAADAAEEITAILTEAGETVCRIGIVGALPDGEEQVSIR